MNSQIRSSNSPGTVAVGNAQHRHDTGTSGKGAEPGGRKGASRLTQRVPGGPLEGRPPLRSTEAGQSGPVEEQEIEQDVLSYMERMQQLNDQQEKSALLTATMQARAANRAEMLQMVRDMAKDAKDAVKDVGEAGHKP